ncbi:SHOCT-like domain-containing protein [Oceanithermus profundus]
MDEFMRIAKLLEEGKIDPEEAGRLLEALDEGGRTPAAAGAAGRLRARLERADLEVRVREGLRAPVVEEDGGLGLRLEAADGGWQLTGTSRQRFLGAFGLLSARKAAVLALPVGVGLELRLGQGEVRVEGALPALKAQLGQGRLRFAAAEALDVQLGQGEVQGSVRITGGRHRVRLGMGRVKLALAEGSDVQLHASTSLGELRVRGGLQHRGEGRAQHFEGALGSGQGRLEIAVGMGEVEVETP